MAQPTAVSDDRYPHHVCHHHKSIYGLKQALHAWFHRGAWFHRLSTFLPKLGFVGSKSDTSLHLL